MIRTAANGGLQVMSPRAVPLSESVHQITATVRQPDLYVVGSTASQTVEWPTVDKALTAHRVGYEPLMSQGEDAALPRSLKTEAIVRGLGAVSDPGARAIIEALGFVDLQRSEEVNGDADGFIRLLEHHWTLEPDTVSKLSHYSLAPSGDLLRFALTVDKGMPQAFMPLQVARCVSVAGGPTVRSDYGEYRSIDWAKARTYIKFAFYKSVAFAGASLRHLGTSPAPGEFAAALDRPGIMVFQNTPGCIFYYGPETFRLVNVLAPRRPMAGLTPSLDAAAIAFVESAEQRVCLEADALVFKAIRTGKVVTTMADVNVLLDTADVVLRSASSGMGLARGRNVGAVLRAYMHKLITHTGQSQAPFIGVSIRMIRKEASSYGVPLADKRILEAIGKRFTIAAGFIRSHIACEADRVGSSLDEFWVDACAMLPAWAIPEKAGTKGWMMICAYYMLNEPTAAWGRLEEAMNHETMRTLSTRFCTTITIPVHPTAPERGWKMAEAMTRNLAKNYSSYYMVMHEVHMVMIDSAQVRLPLMDKWPDYTVTFRQLHIGALLWRLRSQIFQAIVFVATMPGSNLSNTVHRLIAAEFSQGEIQMHAGQAYAKFRSDLVALPWIDPRVPHLFPETLHGPVSAIFSALPPDFTFCERSSWLNDRNRMARYTYNVRNFGSVIEASTDELVRDVTNSMNSVYTVVARVRATPTASRIRALRGVTRTIEKRSQVTGWAWLGRMATSGDIHDQLEAVLTTSGLEDMLAEQYPTAVEFDARVQAVWAQEAAMRAVEPAVNPVG
jgi:hypothetical protein